MWIVVTRYPKPDASVWPGRRWLACIDALGWPAAWIAVALHLPRPGGIAVPMIVALAALFAVRRCWQATFRNERYRFTTWRWGWPVVVLLAFGMLMKLAIKL